MFSEDYRNDNILLDYIIRVWFKEKRCCQCELVVTHPGPCKMTRFDGDE
jgi:hypothetical protein